MGMYMPKNHELFLPGNVQQDNRHKGSVIIFYVRGVAEAFIIIFHRLRSRRPQGFSMHDDHQQLRQSAVLALLLHYPQAIFVHR